MYCAGSGGLLSLLCSGRGHGELRAGHDQVAVVVEVGVGGGLHQDRHRVVVLAAGHQPG